MSNYTVSYNNKISTSLAFGFFVASTIASASSSNIESNNFNRADTPAKHFINIEVQETMQPSYSTWEKDFLKPSQTPIMDAFAAEMDAFWELAERGETEFTSKETVLAERLLELYPNHLL